MTFGWCTTTLGELINVKHGYAFKSEFFATEGDQLVLTPGNFPIGGGLKLRPGKDRYYTGRYPADFDLVAGDLLVVMTDLTQNAPILGSPAFVPPQPRMLHNQRLGLVTVKSGIELDRRYLYYVLLSDASRSQLRATATGTTVRHTAPERIYRVNVKLPPLPVQRSIGAFLGALDALIENNRARVALLEEMSRTIYREWFIHYRFPGRVNTTLVESLLGPVPVGWDVRTVSSIASPDRHAVTSGPFGSKLGRKDYMPQGVPVIRGVNLRVGGGFDESEFVFISEEKADDLRASSARREDIVITQRGTLGQVGFIYSHSRFDRYVLSQSQMKVTVDARVIAPTFFYGQMSSGTTMQRFTAQAMTSGVPHVNLRLLRDFLVLVPPKALQDQYAKFAAAQQDLVSILACETSALVAIRDFLLPKLVTGQIDVSRLDLGALTEVA